MLRMLLCDYFAVASNSWVVGVLEWLMSIYGGLVDILIAMRTKKCGKRYTHSLLRRANMYHWRTSYSELY